MKRKSEIDSNSRRRKIKISIRADIEQTTNPSFDWFGQTRKISSHNCIKQNIHHSNAFSSFSLLWCLVWCCVHTFWRWIGFWIILLNVHWWTNMRNSFKYKYGGNFSIFRTDMAPATKLQLAEKEGKRNVIFAAFFSSSSFQLNKKWLLFESINYIYAYKTNIQMKWQQQTI